MTLTVKMNFNCQNAQDKAQQSLYLTVLQPNRSKIVAEELSKIKSARADFWMTIQLALWRQRNARASMEGGKAAAFSARERLWSVHTELAPVLPDMAIYRQIGDMGSTTGDGILGWRRIAKC